MPLPRRFASLKPFLRRVAAGVLFAASLVLSAVQMGAQSSTPAPPPAPLTLADALRYAADHYPGLRAAAEEVTAASAHVLAARTAFLPRLDGVWQSNRGTVNNITGPLLPQSVVPGISGPPLAATSAQSAWGSAAGALLSWEPFDLGQRAASVHEAEAAVGRARAGHGLTRLQVQQAVGQAYLSTVAARQAIRAAEADVARRDAVARAAQALADAQLRPGAEATRAAAERAAAVTRQIQARQAVAIADATLARVLGTDATPVLADGEAMLARLPTDMPDAAPAATHPLLQAQEAAIALAQARDAVLATSFRPRLLVQASASARGSGATHDGRLEGGAEGLWPERANWAAGLQVVVPNLFDLAAIRARRQAASAATRAEQARLDERRLALTAEQRAAQAQLEAARAIAGQMPVQLEAARTSEAQARARYDAGLASIVEVAESQALLAASEYQDAAARVEVWRALLAHAVATDAMDRFITLAGGGGQ